MNVTIIICKLAQIGIKLFKTMQSKHTTSAKKKCQRKELLIYWITIKGQEPWLLH